MDTASNVPGKTEFIRELFRTNRHVKFDDATAAWKTAGYAGELSPNTFAHVRTEFNKLDQDGGAPPAAAPTPEIDVAVAAAAPQGKSQTQPKAKAKIKGKGKGQGKVKAKAKTMAKAKTKTEAASATNAEPTSALSDAPKPETSKKGRTGHAVVVRAVTNSASATAKPKPKAKPQAQAKPQAAPVTVTAPTLDDVEADIDELIFKLKNLGGMSLIEAKLREIRRMVYPMQK